MSLSSLIEHSYDIPWDPICVPMKSSRHLNVYWCCEQNRPYSGLAVCYHCMTLFRPRTTALPLLSFIEHSYVISWEPNLSADVELEAYECILVLLTKLGHSLDYTNFSHFEPI